MNNHKIIFTIGSRKVREYDKIKGHLIKNLTSGFWLPKNEGNYIDMYDYLIQNAPYEVLKEISKLNNKEEQKKIFTTLPSFVKTIKEADDFTPLIETYKNNIQMINEINYELELKRDIKNKKNFDKEDRRKLKLKTITNILKTIKIEVDAENYKKEYENERQSRSLIETKKTAMTFEQINRFITLQKGLDRQNLMSSYGKYVEEHKETHFTLFFTQTLDPKYNTQKDKNIMKQIEEQKEIFKYFLKKIKYENPDIKEISTFELTKLLTVHKHSLLLIPKKDFLKIYTTIQTRHLNPKKYKTGTIELDILFNKDFEEIKEIIRSKYKLQYVISKKGYMVKKSKVNNKFISIKHEEKENENVQIIISYLVKYLEKFENKEILLPKKIEDNFFISMNSNNRDFIKIKKTIEKKYQKEFKERKRLTYLKFDNDKSDIKILCFYTEEEFYELNRPEYYQDKWLQDNDWKANPLLSYESYFVDTKGKKIVEFQSYLKNNLVENEYLDNLKNNYDVNTVDYDYFNCSIFYINKMLKDKTAILKKSKEKDIVNIFNQDLEVNKGKTRTFKDQESKNEEKLIIDYDIADTKDKQIILELLTFKKYYAKSKEREEDIARRDLMNEKLKDLKEDEIESIEI